MPADGGAVVTRDVLRTLPLDLRPRRIRQVRYGNRRRNTLPERWDWRLADCDPRFVELGRALLIEQTPLAQLAERRRISRSTLSRYLRLLGYRYEKQGMHDWGLVKR